ncbi:MAG TPA: efflux RND transporter periplasmic adaptor subunit [Stellaceae bacterium]|nr:efflux RND transporter periplasmic adaptor subunit [Stellaceae bacterium]
MMRLALPDVRRAPRIGRIGLAGAGAVLAVAAGTALWALQQPAAPAPTPSPPADEGVAAMGRIEPASEVLKINAGEPSRLAALLVARGDIVQKGQVLGWLEEHDARAAHQKEVAAQLDEAKARLVAETALDEARIDDAEIKLQQVNTVTPLQIAAREADVRRLESQLANDTDIVRTDAQLSQEKITSRRTRDDHRTAVLIDQANLTAATAALAELKGRFETERAAAEAEVRLAKAQLESDRAAIPVTSLARQLDVAGEQLREATIYAPIAGRILNIRAHLGEQVGQLDGPPILSMGDTDRMRVVADVYETDIGRVHVGDAAEISASALEKPIAGRVAEIGYMIFKNDVLNVDPAARADARVVEVRIDLDNSKEVERLTNMTVDVRIRPGKAPPGAVAGDP